MLASAIDAASLSALRLQLRHWSEGGPGGGEGLQKGDVLVSNHPQLAGGSHLPDITVMTPVFDGDRIVFFVASRGHHADVGGITPGESRITHPAGREGFREYGRQVRMIPMM